MKKSKFTESQIIQALKSNENGKSVPDICRALGIQQSTFYNWRKKYGGMDASQLSRLKELEEENARLKRMYSELSLDHDVLKHIVEKKL